MKLQPFTVVTGAAPYLPQENLDTDVIIRIERLAALPRHKLGPFAFEALRYAPEGAEKPEFILNQADFRNAPILLAGENFGCGSSREAAVWALQGIQVRCVIAPSFGDIFFSNCFQNGVLPVRLAAESVQTLARACAQGGSMTVDLQRCVLQAPGGLAFAFEVDPMRRDGLLQGLDDVGLTLRDDALIRAWQRSDRIRRPWVWDSVADVPAVV